MLSREQVLSCIATGLRSVSIDWFTVTSLHLYVYHTVTMDNGVRLVGQGLLARLRFDAFRIISYFPFSLLVLHAMNGRLVLRRETQGEQTVVYDKLKSTRTCCRSLFVGVRDKSVAEVGRVRLLRTHECTLTRLTALRLRAQSRVMKHG